MTKPVRRLKIQSKRALNTVLRAGLGHAPDDRAGERAFAHIDERFGVDQIVSMTGTQQFQEIEPALGASGGEPGENVQMTEDRFLVSVRFRRHAPVQLVE